jgi:hypothetical protein
MSDPTAFELRRQLVPRATGTAGRAFVLDLPADALIIGGELRASWLHVDYLSASTADVGPLQRRRGRIMRALSPGNRRAAEAALDFFPMIPIELGSGEYLFLSAPEALPAAPDLGDPAAHEQPIDPAKQGASEGGA